MVAVCCFDCLLQLKALLSLDAYRALRTTPPPHQLRTYQIYVLYKSFLNDKDSS
jgi:hypothetical protein